MSNLSSLGMSSFGGVLLDHPPVEGETPPLSFKGTMIVAAGDIDWLVDYLKKDPYSVAGVWDWEKAEIYPVSLLSTPFHSIPFFFFFFWGGCSTFGDRVLICGIGVTVSVEDGIEGSITLQLIFWGLSVEWRIA